MSRLAHIIDRLEQITPSMPQPRNRAEAEERRLVEELCRILRVEA